MDKIKFLSIKDVASELKCSKMTIERKLKNEKEFPKPVTSFANKRLWTVLQIENYKQRLIS